MAVSATELQTTRRLRPRRTVGGSARQSSLKRYLAPIGFSFAFLLIVVGWLSSKNEYISAEEGLGYALGIVSVTCILILLLYPLRKRVRVLSFMGPTSKWFRNHMFFGVAAPIAALYHCNFQLGSLNSRIALFSALIVASSGFIGRFIYRKIHHGLYGRKASLQELLALIKLTGPDTRGIVSYIPELMRRIAAFDRQVLVPPKGIFESVTLPLALTIRTRIQYFRLIAFTRRSLATESRHSPIVAQHSDRLERATQRYVADHLRRVRRVAEFNAYERLFSLWHKVHLPFFFMLVVSTVIHVFVVHLY